MGPIEPIDVRHLGRERVICCWRIGSAIVDPGPASSLGPLIERLEDSPPESVLVTHIHLDHSGGVGALVERWSHLTVYVHERGARHLEDPSRLLASAERLYGDMMDVLWGEVLPVPAANLVPLTGGEVAAGLEVAYTPGHASHHVSYFDRDSGAAFVGDTGGVRVAPSDFVLPPTPPPDIDIEAWHDSLDKIAAWDPRTLHLTHFGAVENPNEHLPRFRTALSAAVERARSTTAEEYAALVAAELAESTDESTAAAYAQAAPLDHLHPGLARYLSKRER